MCKRRNVRFWIFYAAVFFQFCFAAGTLAVPTRDATPNVLYFVATEAELENAARRQEELGGLGISWQFYRDGNDELKSRVVRLVRQVVDAQALQPVFIYGQNMEEAPLKLLLPEFFSKGVPPSLGSPMADKVGRLFGRPFTCGSSPVMVGVFPTLVLVIQDDTVYIDWGVTLKMCAVADEVGDEQWFRDWLTDFWRREKESLKSNFAIRE